MRVHFDRESGVLYFRLDVSRIVASEEVKPGIVLDYNEQNQVVGVEILDAGRWVAESSLRQMHFELA